MSPLLTLDNVGRDFQVGREIIRVIDGLSLELLPGDSLAVTGPSGSGKSVLLNLIGLLDTPTRGAVLLAGRNTAVLVDDERTYLRNRRIGFVFQHPRMIGRLSLVDNVALPLRYRGIDARTADREARGQLERVGLLEVADHPPRDLSGGQLQLAGLARALVGKPDLILADEPATSLDADSAGRVSTLLQELNRSAEVTLVLATHDAAQASKLARQLRLQTALPVLSHATRMDPSPEKDPVRIA